MKKQLLFASLAIVLMVTGCAQKKVIAEDPNVAGYNGGIVDPNAATRHYSPSLLNGLQKLAIFVHRCLLSLMGQEGAQASIR